MMEWDADGKKLERASGAEPRRGDLGAGREKRRKSKKGTVKMVKVSAALPAGSAHRIAGLDGGAGGVGAVKR